ncbi:four helix bundle protein [Christiangramia sediminis]|uniref:Four helix bundle protein n=1 Tax=Christiangramia sediminis TaxID=2881336 RepID=A0A9X1LK33_9FLAO|nr:four helix bundle protein [Christiangramia sediminis]MCB7481831.1 four helix bundle protein [Christiangramia sediminis]
MVDYRNYTVWKKAHALVLDVYKTTRNFPSEEKFKLISQMNRAALSIPTNIVKGCGRETQKEFLRFLHISSGSAFELEYLILVSSELQFIDLENITETNGSNSRNQKNAVCSNSEN